MKSYVDDSLANAILALGELTETFATIKRTTFLADGVTLESDTDHTVMLGVIGCAFAAATKPELDLGKIAQFSLVHDLVETYAGDTDSFGLTQERAHDKEAREVAALNRIKDEFGATLAWVHETIESYESLATPEARYVKTLDKVLPKITRLVNKKFANRREAFEAHVTQQYELLRTTYGSDQPEALELYTQIVEKVRDLYTEQEAAHQTTDS